MRRHVDVNVALASAVRQGGFDPNTRLTEHVLEVQFREGLGRTHLRVLRDGVVLGEPFGFHRALDAEERVTVERRIRLFEGRPDIVHALLVAMAAREAAKRS